MYPPWMILGSVVGGCMVFGIMERLINAIVSTIWYVAVGFDEGEAKYTFGAMQLMTYSASSFARVLTSLANVFVQAASGVASWMFLALTILMATGIMYMAYEQYPVMAREFSIQYNTGFGRVIHEWIIWPIEFLNLILGKIIPIYNAFTWISKRALKEGLEVPIMESPEPLMKAFAEAGEFAKDSAISLYAYTSASFHICGPNDHPRCVSDIGTRVLDIITPMSHLRKIVGVVLTWIGASVCGPLATPLDILLNPIMDINFAKGIHNLVNSMLWMFIQLPIITEARCRLYKESDGLIMCIPDFQPVFK